MYPTWAQAQTGEQPNSVAGPHSVDTADSGDSKVAGSAKPPVVEPGDDDAASRDPMVVDANANATPGFGAAGIVGGSDAAVIQGPAPSPFPEGMLPTGEPVPISGGAVLPAELATDKIDVDISGFVQAEMVIGYLDNGQYDLTFLPRELELDFEARHGDWGLLRIDLNLQSSPHSQTIAYSSDVTYVDLLDALVEQAYVEWSRSGFTLRGGKMNVPFGSEPLDVIDRVGLSRSTLSRNATPDWLAGFYVGYNIHEYADAYLIAVNGWDLTVDNNPSITFGGGIPHRFGKHDGMWLYEGNLSTLVGVEQKGINNLRMLIDYSASLHLIEELRAALELIYGEEQGLGFNKQKAIDGETTAQWWGGMFTVAFEGSDSRNCWLADFAAELRVEYLHDHDLILDLPHLPRMTTLLGVATVARYRLAEGVDVAIEHKVDFERGDVKGVSVQRNFSSPFEWFVTQEIVLGLVGYF
ncbi:MAG: hypothetical protein A2289_22375 [Deltaproteobacteria bacterium RIFOXYA12_FULL_58_15]|nr:MAG: hypothetical protein A2289_22375 [Deltaproteobacteria bacterium RIFOXYA12_FULL_58_15]OGR09639.1 MAG: hypothetical protein A2341_00305 [Deltaproteobacteria bacterium RIFOXYB12_FULL_58_9]